MPSNAYAKFHKTARRCDTLVSAYTTLHALNGNEAPKDIVRGAVVLAVAALDAYVTDVFVEKLATYLKKHRPGELLIDLLFAAGLDTKEALSLLTNKRPYSRIRNLVRTYYATYTTQKFHVIDSVFKVYGLKNLTKNAAQKTAKAHVLSRVEDLIDRRHEIAHAGDYNKHNRIQDIDHARVKVWLTALEDLVKAMDEIICLKIPTPVARAANLHAIVVVPQPAAGIDDAPVVLGGHEAEVEEAEEIEEAAEAFAQIFNVLDEGAADELEEHYLDRAVLEEGEFNDA
ncbi:hypothetical protein DCO47_04610 [Pseudomonas sp. NDM]|uniref:HEPN domain-containing protein n=1 Tax=Pseudomonas sp. NDM TaxID=2170733 RepID=UPI000D5E0B73|nr:HEPN domain-containing protein [Pseudomonas sp. NDM]PWB37354.1 hypothetical protein DCO47_04610 [Pseudomonas sp. NDM]